MKAVLSVEARRSHGDGTDLTDKSETVVPFAPAAKVRSSNDSDSVDNAGQVIIRMIEQPAHVSRENCQHAIDVAHKLSLQLRAAEDQIQELSMDVRHYQARATRAEQWLLRISKKIEQKFLESDTAQPRQSVRKL